MKLHILNNLSSLKIKKENDQTLIWDIIRSKWIVLGPEEMVRSLYIDYLISVCKVPKNKIAIEKMIKVGMKSRRFDLVIFNENMLPWMAIECKSPDVVLSEKVMNQLVTYNQILDCNYLTLVNGHEHNVFEKDENKYWLQKDKWPSYCQVTK